MTLGELARDVVILACAISAGIHGALVPDALRRGRRRRASASSPSTVLLAGARRRADAAAGERTRARRARRSSSPACSASYALAITTGVPVLHPEPEPVDGLALATKAIEAVGLLAALEPALAPPASPSPPPNRKEPDMNTTRASRPIPLALTALVAFFSALAALAVSNGHDAHAHGNGARTRHGGRPSLVAEAGRAAQRHAQLWEDHITWTRLAIISLTTGSPDTEATVGAAAAEPDRHRQRRQAVLRQGRRQRADRGAAPAHPDRRRRRSPPPRPATRPSSPTRRPAGSRTPTTSPRVLNSVNPRYWKLAALKAEMRKHLTLTTQEAVARLQGNWTADVAAYDRIHHHILHMSDLLSDGLVKQFPKRFR